jgi:UDPglucose 6-dehydrogenase
MMRDVEFVEDPYTAAEGADAVVLVTEWDVLRALDLRRLAATMAQPVLVDLRSVYPPEDVENAGLRWFGIGRAPRSA